MHEWLQSAPCDRFAPIDAAKGERICALHSALQQEKTRARCFVTDFLKLRQSMREGAEQEGRFCIHSDESVIAADDK